ncbi:hypothetical protein BHE74_00044674 [Ensete ventricosum]|nr:hypothetical protein BHE74_00044674 [Ensete ventricosum]
MEFETGVRRRGGGGEEIAYPEVSAGGLADEGVLIVVVEVEHPVVADDGEDGEERGHVELDLELGLVAGGVGPVGGALDGSASAAAPGLVEDVDGAVGAQRVSGARVGPVPRLEAGGEGGDLVPPPHVPLQVDPLHHRHLLRRLPHCRCCEAQRRPAMGGFIIVRGRYTFLHDKDNDSCVVLDPPSDSCSCWIHTVDSPDLIDEREGNGCFGSKG